jgi:hypothetical protein
VSIVKLIWTSTAKPAQSIVQVQAYFLKQTVQYHALAYQESPSTFETRNRVSEQLFTLDDAEMKLPNLGDQFDGHAGNAYSSARHVFLFISKVMHRVSLK